MHKKTIEAYTTNGTKERVKVAELNVDLPDNITEAIRMFGETEVTKGFIKSYVIDQQRVLRGGKETDPEQRARVAAFKALPADEQRRRLEQSGHPQS